MAEKQADSVRRAVIDIDDGEDGVLAKQKKNTTHMFGGVNVARQCIQDFTKSTHCDITKAYKQLFRCSRVYWDNSMDLEAAVKSYSELFNKLPHNDPKVLFQRSPYETYEYSILYTICF